MKRGAGEAGEAEEEEGATACVSKGDAGDEDRRAQATGRRVGGGGGGGGEGVSEECAALGASLTMTI